MIFLFPGAGRSTEAALDEATKLNRELQAEKTSLGAALLSAQVRVRFWMSLLLL